jgi:5'-3' exonuclease
MGIRGLYTYLKYYRTLFDLKEVSNKPVLRIGIDAMSFLYRYRENTKEIMLFINTLKAQGHKLLFIFDGRPPPEKNAEIESRKLMRENATESVSILETFLQSESAKEIDHSSLQVIENSLKQCQSKSWNISRNLRRAFQDLLWESNVPYVKSLSEADDVIIDLFKGGKLDVIVSSDMDYIIAGIKCLWIPSKQGPLTFEEIFLDSVLNGENMDVQQLMQVGVLAGLNNIHCDTAFTWIRYYGSIQNIQKTNLLAGISLDALELNRFMNKPVYSRIRPDHLERVKDFLDVL